MDAILTYIRRAPAAGLLACTPAAPRSPADQIGSDGGSMMMRTALLKRALIWVTSGSSREGIDTITVFVRASIATWSKAAASLTLRERTTRSDMSHTRAGPRAHPAPRGSRRSIDLHLEFPRPGNADLVATAVAHDLVDPYSPGSGCGAASGDRMERHAATVGGLRLY